MLSLAVRVPVMLKVVVLFNVARARFAVVRLLTQHFGTFVHVPLKVTTQVPGVVPITTVPNELLPVIVAPVPQPARVGVVPLKMRRAPPVPPRCN